MRLSDFGPSKPGKLIRPAPDYWAFVPAPLAPKLSVGADLVGQLARAERALGYLSGLLSATVNGHVFHGLFLRREALHAGRLEGSAGLSLLDMFVAEERGDVRTAGIAFALEYAQAFRSAQQLGRAGVDQRLLKGLHRRVAEELGPAAGQFRSRQNWIGPPGCTAADAVYVPPPVDQMHEALAALEGYGRSPDRLPSLLRVALIHYQLHAIHPFAHRSGAVNRLLLGLLLTDGPDRPHIPIALTQHLAEHRTEYHRRLHAITTAGQWEGWFRFILVGVTERAEDTARRFGALLGLVEEFRKRVQRMHGRQASYRLVDAIVQRPVIRIERAARLLGATSAQAEVELERLRSLGILAPHRTEHGIYMASDVLYALEGEIRSVEPAIRQIMHGPAGDHLSPSVARREGPSESLPDLEATDEPWTRPLVTEDDREVIIRLLQEIDQTAALAA